MQDILEITYGNNNLIYDEVRCGVSYNNGELS
jgi:hypothetical protein